MSDKNAEVINRFNKILSWELAGTIQYLHHHAMVSGLWREIYADFFADGSKEARKHAELVANKIVASQTFGLPDGKQRRGDDLHLFQYRAGGYSPMSGYYLPQWSAVAIKPDGKIAPIADEGVDMPGAQSAWDADPKPFNGPDWTSFGMRGVRGGKPKTVTWQWDATRSQYVSSVVPRQP